MVEHIKAQAQSDYNEETMEEIETKAKQAENAGKRAAEDDEDEDWDPVLNDAAEVVINAGGAPPPCSKRSSSSATQGLQESWISLRRRHSRSAGGREAPCRAYQ